MSDFQTSDEQLSIAAPGAARLSEPAWRPPGRLRCETAFRGATSERSGPPRGALAETRSCAPHSRSASGDAVPEWALAAGNAPFTTRASTQAEASELRWATQPGRAEQAAMERSGACGLGSDPWHAPPDSHCTLRNAPGTAKCEACGRKRPTAAQAAAAAAAAAAASSAAPDASPHPDPPPQPTSQASSDFPSLPPSLAPATTPYTRVTDADDWGAVGQGGSGGKKGRGKQTIKVGAPGPGSAAAVRAAAPRPAPAITAWGGSAIAPPAAPGVRGSWARGGGGTRIINNPQNEGWERD
ncbi:MAG: hypothetical protein WDW36_002492 [Sanguina aurantia]